VVSSTFHGNSILTVQCVIRHAKEQLRQNGQHLFEAYISLVRLGVMDPLVLIQHLDVVLEIGASEKTAGEELHKTGGGGTY